MSLRSDCPYCGTQSVAQTAVLSWKNRKDEQRALFQCGHCHEATIYEWQVPMRQGVRIDIMQYSGDGESWGLEVGRQWPEPRAKAAPPDTPPSASRYFEQAVDSLNSNNFDAAGLMFRKALESATKAISPDSAKKPLAARIKDLVATHAITPALGTWADEIRLGGNDAAHEDEPFSEEDADALHNFCENFLRYAFTLPSAVQRRASPKVIGES
jgi:hypothetical protein